MNLFDHLWGRLAIALVALFSLTACGAPQESVIVTAAPSTPTVVPSPTADPSPTTAPSATPAPSPTSVPTRPPETPTTQPSPTADTAGTGLPCPATPPPKPEYARYGVSAGLWPTPDPNAPPPPLSLSNPLPAAGRNTGYPYGSDGSGRYLLHNGLDMADEDDNLAVAAADGTVIVARGDQEEMFGWRCDWYGQLVIIQLDEWWADQPVYVLYGHVKDVQVTEGQLIARGEPVARESAAGVAVVPHLHLEVRAGRNTFGATQNPLLWVEPWSGNGVIAGRLLDSEGHAWQGVTVTLIDRDGSSDYLNTWTYLDDPDHLIQPDPALAENFVFGPVPSGSYDVYTKIQGVEYRQRVEVEDGQLTTVEIVTEPYRTPTPEATP